MQLCAGQEGYNRIDHVIGLVVELVLNGEVVKTVEERDGLIELHKGKLSHLRKGKSK